MTVASALSLEGIHKSFGGISVLTGIDLEIFPGEIHGLIGENGSGKSTLVKVISGIYEPDQGAMTVGGRQVAFPVQAQEHNLAVIHQDLGLVDSMTVAENMGIGSAFEGTGALMPIRRKRLAERVRRLSREFGHELDPAQTVGTLTPSERSLVAILRGLNESSSSGQGEIVILDEPTAALAHDEAANLLERLRARARAGSSLIFISHHLREVLAICDRITVLRSGRVAATVRSSEMTSADLVSLMLGHTIDEFYPDKTSTKVQGDVVLSLSDLSGDTVTGLDLSVRAGEIVGLTGLAGMGQDEVPYLVTGAARRTSGSVEVNGTRVGASPVDARRKSIALVPGNRQRDGIWAEGEAAENLSLPVLDRFRRGRGPLSRRAELDYALAKMAEFGTRPLSARQQIGRFSGGNQQKIVMARAMQLNPKVLILHEPTQGVDAGAKEDLAALVRTAAKDGAAVLVCSSDVDEVAHLCHRAVVMSRGKVIDELRGDELSLDRVIMSSVG